jgi:predicted SnoaL-like aldol condensation-catalyzing enzyme
VVSPQELNKRIVVRFIEELLNEGRLEVADELVAEDFKAHWWGEQQGRESVRAFATRQRLESPDWHIEIDEVIAEGDLVVVRASSNGISALPIFGLQPPSGQVRLPWIAIYRVVEGRITERWTAADVASVLGQYLR